MGKHDKLIDQASNVMRDESKKMQSLPLLMISQKETGELTLIASNDSITIDVLKEIFWVMLRALETAPRIIQPGSGLSIVKDLKK